MERFHYYDSFTRKQKRSDRLSLERKSLLPLATDGAIKGIINFSTCNWTVVSLWSPYGRYRDTLEVAVLVSRNVLGRVYEGAVEV